MVMMNGVMKLEDYRDYYEGFLKGMEDLYTLVWKRDLKSFSTPSMGNWDYDILINMYSVGYYNGYRFYQKVLLKDDENYICFTDAFDKIVLRSYKLSISK